MSQSGYGKLADALTSALVRYNAHDAHALPASTEVLLPHR
jgi:hypothetical protein